jgi:hypothetical protein
MTRAELIAALRRGRASPDMQRRAAELLQQWQPAGRGRPRNDPYAWRDRFDRIETERKKRNTLKAAYVALGVERGVKWTSIKRQHTADKKQNEAFEKFIDEVFALPGDKK